LVLATSRCTVLLPISTTPKVFSRSRTPPPQPS
jgi:hypothetical protein